MRQVHVITDLQYGSTGKGLFAGYLAKRERVDTLVSAWGPNAGHTFIDRHGNKFVNIMVPNGVISPTVKQILLGPGSLIDPERLLDEMTRYALFDNQHVRLAIHENAAVVQDIHRMAEAGYGFKIGSTMKGVGEAFMHKVSRKQPSNVAGNVLIGTPLEGYLVDVADYNRLMDRGERILVEGAQGFSLSINHGFYPYTTSRDCTSGQILSDCAVPCGRGWGDFTVYGVARTYPIRVANRFRACECSFVKPVEGCAFCGGTGLMQVGTSGPCYADQMEIGWEAIGREPELTTVTKLPRRIFTFSQQQIRDAVRMNGTDYVFLNFCNYVKDPLELDGMIAKIEAAGAIVRWTGWGEREDQIQQVRKGV